LPFQLFWFSTWTPYAVICNIIFAPIFSIVVVGFGIILVLFWSLGLPFTEELIIYHTILIEFIIYMISGFYDYLVK